MSEQDFNAVFSKRLKYYLDKYDMTQADLAKRLGVGTTSVYNWCNGLKSPRMDKVDTMCLIFNCKRSDLIEDKPITQPTYSVNKEEYSHIQKYRSIDDKGKHTVDTVLEMEYNRCNKPHLLLNAAHAIEGATQDELQHDEDIMNDENF